MIVNERQSQERKRKRLKVASVCILFAGLVSAVTGFWFVVGDHPFHRTDGFAEEFGMSETEVNEYNPRISEWVRHVSDQVGSVSFGWGLFLITLAWLGIRKGQRWAWITLWIGGTPTAIYSTFGELIMFGHMDTGSILSMVVLGIFLFGMLLPIRDFK